MYYSEFKMPRALAVRASAVLSLLGSLATILLAVLMVVGILLAPPPVGQPQPIPLKPVVVATGVLMLILAVWGIATAISVFRRRRWARMSMLIFGGLLAVMAGISALVIAVMPIPTSPQAAPVPGYIRWAMVGVYGLLAAIGVWWLILFNLRTSVAYFTAGAPAAEGPCPLSISIIAWFLLISAIITLAFGLAGFPVVLLGMVGAGWTARAIYVLWAAVEVYLGMGLMRLRETARLESIAFFAFMVINALAFYLLPEPNARMQAIIRSTWPSLAGQPTMPQASGAGWLILSIGTVVPLATLPVWFLVRRRDAFASAPPATPSAS
jgi:hypothetical protein